VVGGPGFEPGASRSRNLLVPSTVTVSQGFEFISTTQPPGSSQFQPPVSLELLHERLKGAVPGGEAQVTTPYEEKEMGAVVGRARIAKLSWL
jgi:hypothetical protein